ncbi:MAG: hypothetical protein ACKVQT_31445, partial [Burkholderiales bacterium]
GLGDVLSGLTLSLSKLALNAAFKPLENAIGGSLQSLVLGGLGSGSSFALPAGTPELFSSAGTVSAPAAFSISDGSSLIQQKSSAASDYAGSGMPDLGSNRSEAAGGTNVTFHVISPDAESFRRSETQIAAMLARTVGSGQRNL